MLARWISALLQGLEAHPVAVEVDLAPVLPGIQQVGLPDKVVQESRERVRSTLRDSGFRGPLVRRPAEAMLSCLGSDHRSHEAWLRPQTIAAARQSMHDRNLGGVCNRELPTTALGDRDGFAPAGLQLWERCW